MVSLAGFDYSDIEVSDVLHTHYNYILAEVPGDARVVVVAVMVAVVVGVMMVGRWWWW